MGANGVKLDENHQILVKLIEMGCFHVKTTEDDEYRMLVVDWDDNGVKLHVMVEMWYYTYTIHIIWPDHGETIMYNQELAFTINKLVEHTIW